MKHIKSQELLSNDFGNIIVKDLLNEESSEDLSIAEVYLKDNLEGKQRFGLNKVSDIFYYIVEGKGKFFIEDEIIEVNKGDLICIPKNTKYKDEGELKLLAISSPRFSPENHVRL